MNARAQELESLATDEDILALHTRLLYPLKRFFASYRLSSEDVNDLTQEVFVRLAGASRMANLRKPDAFVFTLARNLVRDRARRAQTRACITAVTLEEVELPSEGPTPEQVLEQEDRLRAALLALEGLKPATREAFYLTRVYGHDYAETASQMGVSVSMVEKHVMSAMVCLRDLDT